MKTENGRETHPRTRTIITHTNYNICTYNLSSHTCNYIMERERDVKGLTVRRRRGLARLPWWRGCRRVPDSVEHGGCTWAQVACWVLEARVGLHTGEEEGVRG